MRSLSSENLSSSAENSSSFGRSRKDSFRKTGHLNFTTEYFEKKKILEVSIQNLNLSNLETSKLDNKTFVRLYLEPGKQQKRDTREVMAQQIIQYDERFVFKKLNKADFSKFQLRMKVYDRKEKKKEILGKIDVALNSLSQSKKETFSMKLYRKTSKEVC